MKQEEIQIIANRIWSAGGGSVYIGPSINSLMEFAREVELVECEACANAAEGYEKNRDWVPNSLWGRIISEVVARIRARKMKYINIS